MPQFASAPQQPLLSVNSPGRVKAAQPVQHVCVVIADCAESSVAHTKNVSQGPHLKSYSLSRDSSAMGSRELITMILAVRHWFRCRPASSSLLSIASCSLAAVMSALE
eukprot:2396-Heterococcus_DN1.PRE.2